jgi:hypothetical protein
MPPNKDAQLWQNYFRAWNNFYSAKHDLVVHAESLVEVVRQGLRHPQHRSAALEIAYIMKPEQLQHLFDVLLAHTAYRMSATADTASELILKLPHEWLLENIEVQAEPLLSANDVLDYQGLFVLYRQIDIGLAKRLTERALANSDPEIREAGADFAEVLASD